MGPQVGLKESDKVQAPAGLPEWVDCEQFAGYLTLDPEAGRALLSLLRMLLLSLLCFGLMEVNELISTQVLLFGFQYSQLMRKISFVRVSVN